MRPRDLADGMSIGAASTTVTLPIAEARTKAREVINRASRDGITTVVENWRQRPDGQIEFTIRSFQALAL
jgi:hypothetical protein